MIMIVFIDVGYVIFQSSILINILIRNNVWIFWEFDGFTIQINEDDEVDKDKYF